ncbi:MAG TPA: tRNA (N6-isopentenyl adenosine(37)-C2)-methylthiotransferase MiaB [Bacillota bacterium]|jgi:tRNA-2-methylthio-N6-dimethylallyladenosine synthase|nr:tRNA (N6-isopentenyl adenosine(37)-C2)-methylthiotransferase MiaB [Bacillota bacterium]HOL09859.1 tRNA (N6-isopentenyl adenosine(37)-C2)-methylthiotransferase MiaB [Bacillota bacterium]HPO97581.1 tRNA (N6-isopentenyl adenosine(37)-C2)-methylthiotransferase MiaB [Bacillota bacterium]
MRQKYFITTFGCQMNVNDSEVIAGILESIGYESAATIEAADLVLLNTCCVRENAENRTFGHIGNLKELKEKKPDLIIGLCGCMAQEANVVEKIRESYPHVDLVFGTHNLHQLPELLQKVRETSSRVIEVWDSEGEIHEGLPIKRDETFRAWVTIMYGCNNFCTYCIVPYVRGRERSRKPEVILETVRDLAANGVKEVTLLGQNVNSYGKDIGDGWNFARLLRELAKTDIARIRFQTSHPKDLSDELIEVIAAEPKICRHLHLPFQAGSSRILKLMNRQYTKEQYLELAQKIQQRVTDIALTTDIIVGFPGETDADFNDTLDLVQQVRFDGAFTFIYSPRVGTPAAKMEDPTPEEVKKERLMKLIEIQNKISLGKNQNLVGTLQEVLIEGSSEKDAAIWSGRTSQNKLVHFEPAGQVAIGDLGVVRVTGAKTFTLEGKLLG